MNTIMAGTEKREYCLEKERVESKMKPRFLAIFGRGDGVMGCAVGKENGFSIVHRCMTDTRSRQHGLDSARREGVLSLDDELVPVGGDKLHIHRIWSLTAAILVLLFNLLLLCLRHGGSYKRS